MKVLVIGGGGREHALCWALSKSPLLSKLYCAPGNAGIASLAECLPHSSEDLPAIVKEAKERKIDFVIVGPEIPLAAGLIDALTAEKILCFGPTAAAAQLEASKGFMKDLCAHASIPTAKYRRFKDVEQAKAYVRQEGAPIVIKADGLAAGKGVTVAKSLNEALDAIDEAMVSAVFGNAGNEIVVEEFMQGEELSFFALCDGEKAIPFAAAQDHKAAFDGDQGPNTGGMGAYAPVAFLTKAVEDRIMRDIINPTIAAMAEKNIPFAGMLFAGLMMTDEGPKLIEFNVRFGDPETEAILPRLKSDLLSLLLAAAKGRLGDSKVELSQDASLCVVMAAKGYPGSFKKGSLISGLDETKTISNTAIFHAATLVDEKGDLRSAGGRVLVVTGWGSTLKDAQDRAYEAVGKIEWKDGFCRRDIGWRALAKTEAA